MILDQLRIDYVGGSTTGVAWRPAMVPKFDSVIVAPRSSAAGMLRVRTAAFSASSSRSSSGNPIAAWKIGCLVSG